MLSCVKSVVFRCRAIVLVGATAGLALVSGCGLGTTATPSGPVSQVVHVNLHGGVHGGQQPVYNSTIGLYVAGTSGYGTGSYNLIGDTVTGGLPCTASSTISAFSITSNVVTLTVSSKLAVGSTVTISGLTTGTYLNGQTLTVISSTSTSFTASFTHADVASTADAGTASQSCNATAATTLVNGSFNITGDYTCPSATSQVYVTATGGDPTGNTAATNNNAALELVAALGACGNLSASTNVQVNEVTTAAAAFALAQFYSGFGTVTDSIGTSSSNVAGLVNAFATAHNLVATGTGVATGTTPATGTNYYLSTNDNQKINTIGNVLANCVNQTSSSAPACSNLFAWVTPKYAPLSTSTAATAPVNTFQAAVYMNLNPTSTDASGTSHLSDLFNTQSPYAAFAPTLAGAPTDWTLAVNYTGTGINLLSGVAIDSNGDVWASNANTTGGLVMLNGGTGIASGAGTAGTTGGVIGFFTSAPGYPAVVPNGARTVAIDQNDKAWTSNFTQTATSPNSNGYYMFRASSTGMDSYYKIPTGTTVPYAIAVDASNKVITTTTSTNVSYTSATATVGANATAATVEGGGGNNSLAITPGSIGYVATSTGALYVINTSAVTATTNIPVATTGFSTPYGNAVDATSRLWTANQGNSTLTLYDPAATTFTPITASSCLKTPEYIAIDGNSNVWVSNGATVATSNYGICEFNSSGALISNSIGYNLHGINTGRGIAIDRSGNVWISNYASGANNLTQIVGAAVPAVTPLSVAVKNGMIGTRP